VRDVYEKRGIVPAAQD